MINLLIGVQGSGKSYEAVVFHIIPALKKGRKVITNMPLNIEQFRAVFGDDIADLIVIIEPTQKNPVPFKTIADFGDSWRKEGGNPIGPLYVVDECQKPFRMGEVNKEVEEWFGENRHELADVLLITQSYGKIWKSLRDAVQVVYRVRKNIALGSDKSYVRKVQDGVRGEIVNQTIRTYEPKYFPFYNSHTKSDVHANESSAQDIKPIWKHWTFMLGIPLLIFAIYRWSTNPLPFVTQAPKANSTMSTHGSSAASPVASASTVPPLVNNQPKQMQSKINNDDTVEANHPFYKLQMHIGGFIESSDKKRFIYNVLLTQNGQVVSSVTDKDLTNAGYTVKALGACVFKVTYNQFYDFVTCDAPSISPVNNQESITVKS